MQTKRITVLKMEKQETISKTRSRRQKANKTYIDGMSSSEDEEETAEFDPSEKIKDKDFPPYFVKEMKGEDLTVEYCKL